MSPVSDGHSRHGETWMIYIALLQQTEDSKFRIRVPDLECEAVGSTVIGALANTKARIAQLLRQRPAADPIPKPRSVKEIAALRQSLEIVTYVDLPPEIKGQYVQVRERESAVR